MCKSQGRSGFLFSNNLTSPQVPRSPTGDEKSRRAPVSARRSPEGQTCGLVHVSAKRPLQCSRLLGVPGSGGSFGGRDARQARGDSNLCGQIPRKLWGPRCSPSPRGFEPLRADPNGFRVHLLGLWDTASMRPGGGAWPLGHSVYAPGGAVIGAARAHDLRREGNFSEEQ